MIISNDLIDPELVRWVKEVADGNTANGVLALERFVAEINKRLPAGQHFDLATCRPVIDSGMDADEFEVILNDADLDALTRYPYYTADEQK